jgi:hypothetical protein
VSTSKSSRYDQTVDTGQLALDSQGVARTFRAHGCQIEGGARSRQLDKTCGDGARARRESDRRPRRPTARERMDRIGSGTEDTVRDWLRVATCNTRCWHCVPIPTHPKDAWVARVLVAPSCRFPAWWLGAPQCDVSVILFCFSFFTAVCSRRPVCLPVSGALPSCSLLTQLLLTLYRLNYVFSLLLLNAKVEHLGFLVKKKFAGSILGEQ